MQPRTAVSPEEKKSKDTHLRIRSIRRCVCAAVQTGGGGCETTEAEAGRGAGASGENVGMKITEYSMYKLQRLLMDITEWAGCGSYKPGCLSPLLAIYVALDNWIGPRAPV